ncbi:unnamed protein product [Rotaria sp. Silwood2]|nr:unnamed protein product [Rotaria sp. Silwood2]
MSPINIRTVNGAEHNGQLPTRYQRIQNRAAAVLDAWDEFGESLPIDLIAHMHHINADQIRKDLKGDQIDFKKRFGAKSSTKFEHVLKRCMNEIEEGVDSALAAVAHNIPFMLVRDIQNGKNLKQVTADFFLAMTTSNENKPNTTEEGLDFTTNEVCVKQVDFSRFNVILQESQITSSKRFKKLCHNVCQLEPSQLKLEWLLTNVHGLGLINTNIEKRCLNICYINSIIQCLANTAPFVQWLLNDDIHGTCTLTENDEFCSCCLMRSIIKSIHQLNHRTCSFFSQLCQASAVSMGRQINKLSSSFVVGRQEDPSEFLIVLLNHMIQCFSPMKLLSCSTFLSNPIDIIFGINLETSITCSICFNKTQQNNHECVWSVAISSCFNLKQALDSFCSTEELAGDDMFFCSKCETKVVALKSTKLTDPSPVIFIHLKRFFFDKTIKTIHKMDHFIAYPELLDLSSLICPTVIQSNQENYSLNEFLYQLNSVVVHVGENANNGHIFSYIRSPDNLWYKADDESITRVDLSDVLTDNNSYILCYSKVSRQKIISNETETFTSFEVVPRLLLSSTPKHIQEKSYKLIEHNSRCPTEFSLNASSFEDDSSKHVSSIAESPILNINSSNAENSIVHQGEAFQDNLPSSKVELSSKNILESVELDTESRIEFISSTNHHQERPSNLNLYNTSNSSSVSRSKYTLSSTKNRVRFSDDITQLCIRSQQSESISNFKMTSDSPADMNGEDSQDKDYFQAKLPSSYQFKLQEPIRSLIKQQFAYGASVYRVHHERLRIRTREEKEGYNYDATDADESLFRLNKKFQQEVNPQGRVVGAIQQICKYPYQIIVYTESSIRLFDTLLKHKNIVLSWDATGSVIKEKKSSPRLLYYELSITLPGIVSEDSIVPVTFMISDAHSLLFVNKPFPRPQLILSDRAQIFLLAALHVWNNESLKDFLNRAYRIVNDNTNDDDLKMTNIHACLAHVLLDTRKTINKYIVEEFRELAMWSIALLINTSTWYEFKQNWKLICLVFIQLHFGESHANIEHKDALLDKIKKIKLDTNTAQAITTSESAAVQHLERGPNFDPYTFNDLEEEEENNFDQLDKSFSRVSKKLVVDEEKEANATDSPFKIDINNIFRDAIHIIGVSLEDVLGTASQGILRWFKYLINFFMPTLPIWSNLLIGDLGRHRRRIVQSYERILIMNPQQKTTAISERRMGILKRTQLDDKISSNVSYIVGGHIHVRVDVLLSIIIPDMLTIIEEFSSALLNYCTTTRNSSRNDNSMILDERRLKPIEERWRQSSSKRDHGYYSKGPDEPVFSDLVSSLLSSRNNVNINLKLPSLSPEWLNVAIGLVLSTGNNSSFRHRTLVSSSSNTTPLINAILKFIEDWSNSATGISQQKTIQYSLAINESNDLDDCSTFILEHILIPLLPCTLIVDKVHACKQCEFVTKRRTTISSIPVHVLKTGLNLEQQLYSFFSPMLSDLLCFSCKTPTTRHIEVVEWPPILLINVNDSHTTVKFRKPPGIFSLAQFSSWSAIGGPSAAVYNLICFNTIIRAGINNTMIRVTRIKRSWSTSINKKLIGEGEQFRRLYANSRNLIFERVNDNNKLNIIHAIIQCSLSESQISLDNIPSFVTLQEACSFIQIDHALIELNHVLIAHIKTYFFCYSCHRTSDSLTFIDRSVRPKDAFNGNLKLIDVNNAEHSYSPRAILIISRYDNTIAIIKQESNKFIQYVGNTYLEQTPISYSKLTDLFDTSGAILVFHHQAQPQVTQSNMRIVSYSEIQGVPQIIIQSGNKFFSVCTKHLSYI